MQSTLADTGPLVALFDRDDGDHRRVTVFLKTHTLRLVTTWPVVVETYAVLAARADPAQFDFMDWVMKRGAIGIEDLVPADLPAMLALLRKYADLPMDLADASLVVLAERTGRDTIVSLDSDFEVYRLRGKRAFRNLLARRR